MNREEVLQYFKSWGGNALQFTDMLMRKSMFTARDNCKVNVNGKMRGAKEVEQIFILADDMAIEGLIK